MKVAIDPATDILHARRLAFGLNLEGGQVKSATKFILGMYRAFMDTDASIVEINPLVVAEDGEVMALDAKMNFDDNALFRHKDIQEMRDEDEEEPAERKPTRTTSSSTATSTAWSTEPASPWGRWT